MQPGVLASIGVVSRALRNGPAKRLTETGNNKGREICRDQEAGACINSVNHTIHNMKQYTFFLLPLALIISCKATKTDQSELQAEEIQAIKIYTKFPGMVKSNEMLYWNDTITIYRYRDYSIYETVRKEFNYFEITDPGTITTNKVPGQTSTKEYPVFTISKQGVPYGYYSDTTAYKRVRMDSVLQGNSMYDPQRLFAQTIEKNNAFFERRELKNGETVELFLPRSKPDASYEDTSYLYYSNTPEMLNTNFTFSPKRDSLTQKKFYKIRSLYLADPKSDNPNLKVNRDVEFRFERAPLLKEVEIRALLKKFIPMLK